MALPQFCVSTHALPFAAGVPDQGVKRVLTIFKCHFDAGFTNTQAAVVDLYFREFFPKAIRLANELRQAGEQRYVWTTGSWLLYEYLERASATDRKRMEEAISAGDIAWHAVPFTWQAELMDQSMIAGSLAFSQALDRRFGTKTTGAKLTDVPGQTRGIIAPLARNGITFLNIGVNGGSRVAEVPPFFLWKNRAGESLAVMYHHSYGAVMSVPDSDLAIAIMMRGDNNGPHSREEVAKIYSDLKERYPNAEIIPTNLSKIASALEPLHNKLPVVTQEIGDTWIYGISSDPVKIAKYREISRLRSSWIAQGKFRVGDATDIALLRPLLLAPEHTWGTDTKRYIDYDHYKARDLAEVLSQKNYQTLVYSWEEKRQAIADGIAALPAGLRTQAEVAVRNLDAKEPVLKGTLHPAEKKIETAHFILGFDPSTGAIQRLRNKASGKEWASPDHPLAAFSYQTLSKKDFDRFFSNYIISKADWVVKDFGKPNIETFGVESRTWQSSLSSIRVAKDAQGHRVLAQLAIRDAEALQSGRAAFPQKMYLELILPVAEPLIYMNFYCFQKPATRIPEALWLTFNPAVSGPEGWILDKSGEEVSPLDVVVAGGRHMHAVSTGFRHQEQKQGFAVETVDAPLVAFGEKSPLSFTRSQPDLSSGVHCNLFNNAWGTNYIQWFGEDMRFRFVVRC